MRSAPHVGQREIDVGGGDEADAEQRRDPAPDLRSTARDPLASLESAQERSQRAGQQRSMFSRVDPRSHQSDAPDLAGERTEAGADLDAVILEQLPAHARLVDARPAP